MEYLVSLLPPDDSGDSQVRVIVVSVTEETTLTGLDGGPAI